MHHLPGQPSNKNQRKMVVYGNSVLSIEPEVAEISLGVVTDELELQLAQQNNAAVIEQVIQSLLELGIAQESIQTADYTAHPLYDYADGQQSLTGYQVTHMLAITIENINRTGAVIDTAVQHGANRVAAVSFTIKNQTVYYQQALKMALRDASAKAQALAGSMRLSLNPAPVQIVEQTINPPPVPYQTLTSFEISDSSTPIHPGRLDIRAEVEVEFSYLS